MRQIFSGMLLLSLSLSTLVGSVFAWGTGASAHGQTQVGKASFAVHYEPKCLDLPPAVAGSDAAAGTVTTAPRTNQETTPTPLPTPAQLQPSAGPPTCLRYATAGPDDGMFREVGDGIIVNTGDFDLVVTTGTLTITGLGTATVGAGADTCVPSDFTPRVVIPLHQLPAHTTEGVKFIVDVAVRSGAPDSCVNRLLSYTLSFNASGATP